MLRLDRYLRRTGDEMVTKAGTAMVGRPGDGPFPADIAVEPLCAMARGVAGHRIFICPVPPLRRADRAPLYGRGRTPQLGGLERKATRPIAPAYSILMVAGGRWGALATSLCGYSGSGICEPRVPTPIRDLAGDGHVQPERHEAAVLGLDRYLCGFRKL